MANIAFIGREHIIRVFNYFGTSVFQVSTPQEADAKLQELTNDTEQEWGIVYLEESLAESLQERIKEYNRQALPVISIFPGSGEKKNIGSQMLYGLVRKVIGIEMGSD